jgi:hypothetical protein
LASHTSCAPGFTPKTASSQSVASVVSQKDVGSQSDCPARCLVAVAVVVAVREVLGERARVGVRVVVVREGVAVLVEVRAVAELWHAGIHVGACVVAIARLRPAIGGRRAAFVRHRRRAVAVAVGVGVARGRIGRVVVDRSVAVVVVAVADLGPVRADRAVRVVAVVRVEHVALDGLAIGELVARIAVRVAVEVAVPVDDGCPFVGREIAVVVLVVADFGRARVARKGRVVAVVVGRRVVRRLFASRHRRSRHTVPVVVAVEVPERRIDRGGFVGALVAVVVDAVARFRRLGVDRRHVIVAIAPDGHVVGGRRAILHGRLVAAPAVVIRRLGTT